MELPAADDVLKGLERWWQHNGMHTCTTGVGPRATGRKNLERGWQSNDVHESMIGVAPWATG